MTVTILLLAAAGANGLLTGASLDQSVKQLPARRRIGALEFSRYSQAADLSNGVPWYAALGIGTAVLTLAAALAGLVAQPTRPSGIALGIALAATIAHSFATARAAPINFQQRNTAGDEAALADLFDRFERWQTFRATCQVLALIAVLAALAAALP
jgi:hypothetical protein